MKILAFGEILYDVDVKKGESILGGAPMNFCSHLSKLGASGYMLSSVGDDELGREALGSAEKFNVNTKYVLVSKHPTGMCNVTYKGAEPDYDLSMISAYDNIEVTDEMIENIEKEGFDVFYLGTLAQRGEVSFSSLRKLLGKVKFPTVFYDMNLRQHYHTREILEESLKITDILKINRDEFAFLKENGFAESVEELSGKYNIEKILLTLDSEGARLYDGKTGKTYIADGVKTEEVSSVGAGDSMCACFLYNYLKGNDLQTCLDRANIMAAFVVSRKEAIPEYTKEIEEKVK